ncbi:MAG: hypothetical protein QM831_21555 [Kofleriaceae bacterium]
MKTTLLVTALTLGTGIAYADDSLSLNDNSSSFDHDVKPLSNAIEIGLNGGYAQGAGPVGNDMSHLNAISGAGGQVELSAAYRINPWVSVGLYGNLATFTNSKDDPNDNVYGAGAGIIATAHIRPAHSIDPWVSVSGGWKGLWLDHDQGKTTSFQGFDLARLQLGVDYRITREVAIAPMIGGSLAMYVSQDGPMTTSYDEIQNKKVNFTGFAGLQGRFGIGL